MPRALAEPHAKLDRAVELCYSPQPFQSNRQSAEHLFALYETLTTPPPPAARKVDRKARPT